HAISPHLQQKVQPEKRGNLIT
ncbi:hypothetical protein VCHENC02_1452B, partial [Vibrio harveyi]